MAASTPDRIATAIAREPQLCDVDTAALTLRVIRDDLYQAWQTGRIGSRPGVNPMLDVETYLNDRIRALGHETLTGDTTTPGFAGYELVRE